MTQRAVFPGTFDPIHFGHIDIARRGCSLFDELVVAVYDRPLKSLLFSPEERMELVRTALADGRAAGIAAGMGLGLAACETAEGFGEDVEDAGEAIQDGAS